MALISAFTLIRCLAIFHITLAYFLLTDPQMLVDQNLVVLLGQSMRLVTLPSHLNAAVSQWLTYPIV